MSHPLSLNVTPMLCSTALSSKRLSFVQQPHIRTAVSAVCKWALTSQKHFRARQTETRHRTLKMQALKREQCTLVEGRHRNWAFGYI